MKYIIDIVTKLELPNFLERIKQEEEIHWGTPVEVEFRKIIEKQLKKLLKNEE